MKLIRKLGLLGVVFGMLFVALNFAAIQSWDVPLIGVQQANAGTIGCYQSACCGIGTGCDTTCKYIPNSSGYSIGCFTCPSGC